MRLVPNTSTTREELIRDINVALASLRQEILTIKGLNGTIKLYADLDLQGHKILNAIIDELHSSGS